MADEFDTDAVKKKFDDLNQQSGGEITSPQQRLADISQFITDLQKENADLRDLLMEKSKLIETYEDQIQSQNEEITDLTERNKALRQKNQNCQANINTLRKEKKELQVLVKKTTEGLKALKEQSIASVKPSPDTEIVVQEKIAAADRGKHRGIFVCCGANENKGPNLLRFEGLQEKFPQIDWGGKPIYMLPDRSKLRIPDGTTFVVIFVQGFSHPYWEGMANNARRAGVHLVTNNNFGRLVQQIRQLLKHPQHG